MNWKFLRESKNYIVFVSVLFVGFTVLGFLFPYFFTGYIEKLISTLAGQSQGLDFWQLFLFIFENNLKTSFIGMIFGIFFGILPVFYIVINGYVLGYVMARTSDAFGMGVLFRLLPHGIFELPAVVISLALGLRLGLFAFRKKRAGFWDELENSLRVFLFIIIPLLLAAAVIEAGLIILLG